MTRLRRRSFLAATGSALTLVGCGGGSWLGEAEDPPLPGERKPVLLIEETVRADPSLANLNVVLPPPRRNPEWPQAGGNASHAMHHLEVADTIKETWRADIGAGSSGRSRLLATPVMAGGKVFTIDADGLVRAFAPADGRRLWEFSSSKGESADRLLGGTIASDSGWLFVTTAPGNVIGLNAETGTEVWHRPLRAPIRAAPTVAGDRVLIPTADNQLFALDGRTGEILWRQAGLFEQAAILGGASPAANDTVTVAAFSSGEVMAIGLQSGQPLWNETVLRPRRTLAIGDISDIVGDPVIDGDRVIVAGASGEMASFDLIRGGRTWSADVTSTQTPWIAGDFLYVITERSELVCMLRQGGRIRWVSPLATLVKPDDPDSPRIRWSGPVLASDRLLVASSESEVLSVSPYTGEILGKASLPGPVSLPPIIADGTAYFLTDEGELLAYR